jgi:uncharacterized protein with GYD domain
MKLNLFVIATALAIGIVAPASAQQSNMVRYVTFFKYTDQSYKALVQNPQDRTATVSKLAENFGGKLEHLYYFATGGEYDGMVIWLFPDNVTAKAVELSTANAGVVTTSGRFVPLMTPAEFKGAMEKAAAAKPGYMAPAENK